MVSVSFIRKLLRKLANQTVQIGMDFSKPNNLAERFRASHAAVMLRGNHNPMVETSFGHQGMHINLPDFNQLNFYPSKWS